MKYEKELRKISDRPWIYHNIDYSFIKSVIKEQTTPGKTIYIPKYAEDEAEAFEIYLYNFFKSQIDNINDFTKTKVNEIRSIYEKAQKKVDVYGIKQGRAKYVSDNVHTIRLDQYARLEQQVIKGGDILQALTKFVTLQETAIRKLLKKYRKWTGRATLASKVKTELQNDPAYFGHIPFPELYDTNRELRNSCRVLYRSQLHLTNESRTNSSASSIAPSQANEDRPDTPNTPPSVSSLLTDAATAVDSSNELDRPWLKRTRPDKPRRKSTKSHSPSKQRYWSEYDHPSDGEDGADAYMIYIDPNERGMFDHIYDFIGHCFGLEKPATVDTTATSPLLPSTPHSEINGTSSSDESPFNHLPTEPTKTSTFGTFTNLITRRKPTNTDINSHHTRPAHILPPLTSICFLASLTILSVAVVLFFTGRHKLVREVEAGVIFAVVFSILFMFVGLGPYVRALRQPVQYHVDPETGRGEFVRVPGVEIPGRALTVVVVVLEVVGVVGLVVGLCV